MGDYFNEKEFTSLFFALLYREGITKINKEEILKKLCYYYHLPDYKCLFYDIGLLFGFNKIDLNKSITVEKEINNIKETANTLNLDYNNYDYKNFLATKSVECLTQMNRLVKEFAKRLKIEEKSKYPMNIYYDNADGCYNVFQAKYQNKNVYWQLITNGKINENNDINLEVNYSLNPLDENSRISLTDVVGRVIEVYNASYTILKGMSDEKIGVLKVFTKINNEEDLKKMREYANDEEILLHRDKDLVRKLYL